MNALAHRQIAVALSVVVIRQDGPRFDLLAWPVVRLTGLVLLAWRLTGWLTGLRAELSGWLDDIAAAVRFTAAVCSIALNALAFGLGVTQ
ncbi:MAG: hypothetical protein D6784_00405 [Chloroflexi bacterium]|nr:MAG: hypothetical protein D6784_00405 [Chloroflexota bacterium]